MEVFSLMAKLTLDTEEYEKALAQAESEGEKLQDPDEPSLGLDKSEFDAKILSAENTDVTDPESPDLDLDKDAFDDKVDQAERINIGDPDSPSLDLNDEPFSEKIDNASEANVPDPNQPQLVLSAEEFWNAIGEAGQAIVGDPAAPQLLLDVDEFYRLVAEAGNTDVADPETPTLTVDTQPYENELLQAEADTKLFSDSVGNIFDGLKSALVGAGITTAIAGIGKSLSEAVDLARSLGDNIDKSSRAMSISTDAYQEWSHVLDINGASITDLNRGLINMRKMLGGGEVSKDAQDAFTKLGLSAKVANGEITTTEDLLKASIKALADWDTSTDKGLAERDLIAQELFGRGGTKLNALFDGTSQDIDYLIAQAHELGLVMSQETVANAASYNDAVTNMQESFQAFKVALVEDMLPALTEVANTVAKIIAFFNPRNAEKSLSDMFGDSDQKFAKELVTIEGTSAAAETLADKLLAMGDTSKMTAEQYALWESTANKLIELVPSLGEIIDTETGQIAGNSESIKENIKQWENLAKQKALQTLKEEKYQAIVEKNKELIDATSNAMEAEAKKEEARVEAYHNFSDEMKRRGLGELDFEAGDLDEQISNVMQMLADMGDAGETDALALGTSLKKIGEANTDLQKATAEVQRLKDELAAGKAEYETWLSNVESMYGETAQSATDATSDVSALKTAIDELPERKGIILSVAYDMPNPKLPPKAKGDWDVPYDMPVFVHRGERILTASQARGDNSSGVGTEAIVGAILGLRNDLQQLQLVVNSKTFGRAVVDYGGDRVDNYIGSSESRADAGYGT